MPRFHSLPAPSSRTLLPARSSSTLLAAAALVAALLLAPLPALAQDGDDDDRQQSIPPFPVVYLEGTALLDGEPVAEGEIVVRVGDWERPTRIPIRNGMFTCAEEGCLLVGPPGYAYAEEPVTFHLNGELQADLTYPFPLLGTPCFVENTVLRFGEGVTPRSEDQCPGIARVEELVPPSRRRPRPPRSPRRRPRRSRLRRPFRPRRRPFRRLSPPQHPSRPSRRTRAGAQGRSSWRWSCSWPSRPSWASVSSRCVAGGRRGVRARKRRPS